MKCSKCEKENIYNANFCKYCKNKFTNEEKVQARNKTFIGKLEKIKDIVSLNCIFGNKIFKIVSLIIIAFIGLILYCSIGNNIKILNSKEYKIQYNKLDNEYYLITENDSINLKLYIPNSIKEIKNKEIDKNDNVISENILSNNTIALNTTGLDKYYLFETNNKHKNIKIYVYKVNK